jgi:hypothetical protein
MRVVATFQTILLASAAGFAAVAGAEAADLPSKKAAPVESVKVCNVAGITGWTLPGTDVCVRLSGYVSAQFTAGNIGPSYGWGSTGAWDYPAFAIPKNAEFAGAKTLNPGARALFANTDRFNRSETGWTTRGNTTLDFATPTAYGPLVGHFDLNSDWRPPQ